MSEMKNELNRYYEEVGIASVKKETRNDCYDYDKMFRSFRCPNKDSCRNACKEAQRKDPEFRFSPRTEGVEVSRCYEKGEYKDRRIPRIVVISLSVPQPEIKAEQESKPFSLPPHSHWRGTTTTVRSLLDPFIELKPAKDEESTKMIEQLFVHVRTAKCFSNVGGSNEEPAQLYKNCGVYLSKEVSILKPDVIVTQGGYAHKMSEQYVFDVIANRPVKGIANSDSIACAVHLKKDKRRVYWLKSRFPGGRWCYKGRYPFYSLNHAGPRIDSESHIEGAKLKNLVLYGQDRRCCMNPIVGMVLACCSLV
ncbi:MAG: hypothetical protein F4X75_14890, partial [Gemmatimonadetes bacterium]|nr:hypothetical protein [Gemmatimonadota bacterium]